MGGNPVKETTSAHLVQRVSQMALAHLTPVKICYIQPLSSLKMQQMKQRKNNECVKHQSDERIRAFF